MRFFPQVSFMIPRRIMEMPMVRKNQYQVILGPRRPDADRSTIMPTNAARATAKGSAQTMATPPRKDR